MQPIALVVSIAVGVVALGAAVWFGRAPEPPPLAFAPIERVEREVVIVHVAGAVQRPGLVSVTPGARVADAIAAAGGATSSARLIGLNLAAVVSDGQQIVVPDASDVAAIGVQDGRVAVNRATVDELQQLPGVGAVLAQRIVQHRESFGDFVDIEDLLDVPGIGEAKLDGMRDSIIAP